MRDDHIQLLRGAWAAYERGDIDGFSASLAEDWCEHDGQGNTATLDDERHTMEVHRLAFPDKH